VKESLMGQNSHTAESRQNNASSGDKPGPIGKTPADRKPGDQQNQATIEEFDREGLGVAPKE
jgi:hypothetical protein